MLAFIISYLIGMIVVLAFFAGHGKQRRGYRPVRTPQHERPKPTPHLSEAASVLDAEILRRLNRTVS